MNLISNPYVKTELDNLERQFGNKAYLTLDDYSELYGIDRRFASRHAKRRNVPFSKEGRQLYISMLDFAIFKVKSKEKSKVLPLAKSATSKDEMKRRRGFSATAERKQLAN
ncbi:MAG: hypothetical protein FWB96_01480 [Defluviitaleaceae bacterium]|nr:hypothetical protein [Defluviitaleaceae bacterium]MCL2261635.1 hypothetical protein [Defluviitaleaceae bacterium]